jgi:hypothetical protein
MAVPERRLPFRSLVDIWRERADRYWQCPSFEPP